MLKKGIVMQIANGHAIVMTQDCEFRKIPLLDEMAIGQEVEFEHATELPQTNHKKAFSWINTPWKKTGIMAASLLLAVGVWSSQTIFNPPQADAAVAYFTVDINPSVELSVDAQEKVVTVTALNSDAAQMISKLNLKGLPVKQAVSSLTNLAKSEGFLKVNTEVLITATPAVDTATLSADHVDLDTLEGDLVDQVQTAVKSSGGSGDVEVEGIRVSNDLRTAAQKAGISPGKYAVYLSLQSKGINVSIDDMKKDSISQVVADRGTDAATVLQDLKGGDQLDQLLKQFQAAAKQPGQAADVPPLPNKGTENGKKPALAVPGQAIQSNGSQVDKGNDTAAKSKGKPSGREPGNGQGNGNHQHPAADHKDDQGNKGDRGNQDGKGTTGFQTNLNGHGDSEMQLRFPWMFGHEDSHGQQNQDNHDKQEGHGEQNNQQNDKNHH